MGSDYTIRSDSLKEIEGSGGTFQKTKGMMKMRGTVERNGETFVQVRIHIKDPSVLKSIDRLSYNASVVFNKAGLGRWIVQQDVDGRDMWINKMSLHRSAKANELVNHINEKILSGGSSRSTDFITSNKEKIIDIYKQHGKEKVYDTFFLMEGKKCTHLKMEELGTGAFKTRVLFKEDCYKPFLNIF